jgi:hypothetical protein
MAAVTYPIIGNIMYIKMKIFEASCAQKEKPPVYSTILQPVAIY